ncbi:MAG: VWA domain-containing protein [Chloroherpetonaceae bacterium]|nr:VWA domain-containing protein [Chloroherpetonaceae bacterium]MDW8437084.1 vWA domain-containing protein [Chloroherpetonaceae bacterium]
MRNLRFIQKTLALLLLIVGVSFFACQEDESPLGNDAPNRDIPADPGGSAPATTINNVRPAATFAKTQGNENRIRVSLLGIIDPTTGQPIAFSGNQNLFVTEDNALKGVKLTRVSSSASLAADIVFVVDNSGSMFEEADSIAAKIIAFANALGASGLNARFGCVGYDGPVTGALDLTVAESLRTYLNRPGFAGTSRTRGFGGPNAQALQQAAQNQNLGIFGENGIVGIRFADSLFAWRQGAMRVYVNFTDEPTQPSNRPWHSTDGFLASWSNLRGTIHTVWSGGDTTWTETPLFSEKPWRLSIGTGGTIRVIRSDARDLDLTTLPVTVALQNSWLVEFRTSNSNAPHTVRITVKTSGADGETRYENIRY